jgi:hypothetical protein
MIDLSKLTDEQLTAFEKAYDSGIAQKIIKEAQAQKLDPDFALATVYQESRFNPNAHSDKDAYGLFQITPPFAKDYNIKDRKNIDENIAGGVRGLKNLVDQYDGNKRLALIAYNAGPSTKYFETKNLADLPEETVNYLDDIDKLHSLDLGTAEAPKADANAPKPKQIKIHDRINPELAGTVGAGVGFVGGTLQQGKKGIDYINDRKVQAEIQIAREKAALDAAARAAGEVPPSEELPGDKWNRKVVGNLGPGAASSTEAAKNYRLQQSLSPEETSSWKASREGLIVPNKLEKPAPPPKPPTMREKVTQLPGQIVRSAGTGVGTVGNTLNRVPMATSPLGMGGAGYMGAEAYNRFQKARELYEMGRTKEAAQELAGAGISGVGALGALASLVPPRNPILAGVKGVGALTGTLAPAALKAYDEYLHPDQ